MAYPVKESIQTAVFASNTSPANVPWPDGLLEDDEVYIYAGGLIPGTVTLTGAGTWHNLNGTGAIAAGAGQLWGFHQRVTASGLTAPTIAWSSASSRQLGVIVCVVRGANTTGEQTSEGALVVASGNASQTTPALTVTEDPQLIMIPMVYERTGENAIYRATEAIELGYAEDPLLQGFVCLAYTYASSSDPRTFSGDTSNVGTTSDCGIAAHAVVDNGNAEIINYSKWHTSELVIYNQGQQQGVTRTVVDVTDVAHTPQITGTVTHPVTGNTETVADEAIMAQGGSNLRLSLAGPNSGLTPQSGPAEDNKFLCKGIDFTANPLNLSGSKITFAAELDRSVTFSLSRFGHCIGFGDGTNVAFYLYAGSDDLKTGWNTFSIDAGSVAGPHYPPATTDGTTGYEIQLFGTGPLDWTSIKEVIWEVNGATSNAQYFGCVHVEREPLTVLGGYSGENSTFEGFYEAAFAGGLNTVLRQGANQYFTYQSLRIGDGSKKTVFGGDSETLEFPATYDYSQKNVGVMADEGAFSFEVLASANCSIDLSKKAINFGNFHQFIVDSLSSSSATYNFNGLSVVASTPSLYGLGPATYAGITINGCREITHANFNKTAGRTFGAMICRNCADPIQITVTSKDEFEALQNVEFSGNGVSIKITGNQTGSGAGAWDGSGITVAGGLGAYDIEYTGTTDFEISFETGSGVVQGRVDNTAAVGAGNTGLTVVSPVISLTVTSDVASSDIKIFPTGSQTEVTYISNDGTTAVYQTAGTYDITVMKAGFLPQRRTGIVLGTENNTQSFTHIDDPIYNASHGLTFTTDYSYNATTRVMTIVANQEGRDLYSALIDDFITETGLNNRPFPITAVGPDRFDFISDGTTASSIDAGDIQFWKGAGMVWENATTGNPAKKFYSIKSSNTLVASSVVGYTQTNTGTPVEATLVSNQVNQVIQFYEDTDGNGTPDYDRKTHLLFKGFLTGYYQARWDVINDGGISELEPYEYTIALTQDAIAGTTGDQAVTITTLTDHTGAPIDPATSGDDFDYELVDPGTNTAAVLLAQLNYDVYNAVNTAIAGALYTSYVAFELPDLIIEAGSTYETEAGFFEGDGLVTDRSGVYVSRSSADHPDVARYQSNDLTYYVKPVTADITITNLPDNVNSRLQIYNVTTVAEYYNDDPAGTGYSESYTDGVGISAGDTIRIRYTDTNAGTSYQNGETFVVASSSGFSVDGDNFISADTVYATYGIDGSSLTGSFTADFVNDEVDIIAGTDFTAAQMYAWWCYNLTTSQGISDFYGGIIANDSANLNIKNATVSIYLDNTTTTNIKQTDNVRIYRDDEAYPVRSPTSGGGGIDVVWRDRVFVVNIGGSSLTPAESALLTTINSTTGNTDTKVTDLHNAEGLDSGDSVTISGDGETSSVITTTRLTKTITPTGITRA